MDKKRYHHAAEQPAGGTAGGNKSKKIILLIAGSVVVLAIAFIVVWFFFLKDYFQNKNAKPVLVTSLASITGTDLGISSRYAGVVEPQKAIKVNKDDTKVIDEIFVTEGQRVKAGDPLFSYDVEEMNLTLEQTKLAVENANNTIEEYQRQISDLEKERNSASSDNKLSYTIKIQTLQLNIKEQQYESSTKKKEIDKLTAAIENNVVKAPEDGLVQSVNQSNNQSMMNMDEGTPAFISILSTGDYRIKGTITEQQRYQVSEGMPVIVHSRINPEHTWTGTIESIDFENPASDNKNGGVVYMGGGDSGATPQTSSRYNFYVTLDDKNVIAKSADDMTSDTQNKLIIGQHVYIEPSTGDDAAAKSGIWLPSYYLAPEGADNFVWVQNKHQKLEKRSVTVGAYDDNSDLYEITEGLTKDDYLAIPEEKLRNGMPTTTDPSLAVDDNMMNFEEGEPEFIPENNGENMDILPEENIPQDNTENAIPETEGEPILASALEEVS